MRRHALLHRPLRLGLAWLMGLALLLPLAQLAGAWHELQHAAEASGLLDAKQKAAHAAGCVQCLASAAVHGAGLLPTLQGMPPLALGQVLHARGAGPAHGPASALAYRSRAPPRTPR